MTEVLTFEETLERGRKAKEPVNVLLGNGFSIGAYEGFKYKKLYEEACKEGLGASAQGLFEYFGTANFEDILKRLDDGMWLSDYYGLSFPDGSATMHDDKDNIKDSLTKVIARVHPATKFDLDSKKLVSCAGFLERFDSVFTTNYDILIYWAFLATNPPVLRDAFFNEGVGYQIFEVPTSTGRTIHYLHGALHIYGEGGEFRKRKWDGVTPLIEQVHAGFEADEYPLIVTEGKFVDKKTAIEASGYLSWCLQELQTVGGTVLVYGSALGKQDDHLWKAIVDNRYLDRLAVALHGDPESSDNTALIARAKKLQERRHALSLSKAVFKDLDLWFFDSDTAHVWDAPEASSAEIAIK
ncbi:MAG: DUF4917 family protein [Dehalococcoidia bacterium]